MLTINRNGQNLLYSKGYGENNVFGRKNIDKEEFRLMKGQTANSSFEKVFLFESVSFGVDNKGLLWVLGGKMALENEKIFPMELEAPFFKKPTKTKLHLAVQQALVLG